MRSYSSFCTKKRNKIVILFLFGLILFTSTVYYQFTLQLQGGVQRLNFLTSCNIPYIDPYSKSAKLLIEIHGKIDGAPQCIGAEIKFRINEPKSSLIRLNSDSPFWNTVICCYSVFEIKSNYTFDECFPILSEETFVPHHHANLDIKCMDKSSLTISYRDQFYYFRKDESKEKYADEKSVESGLSAREALSVLIIGLDSVSHQNFVRYMPQTHEFLIRNLSAIEYFGLNKVGSGTIANVLAMLTGCEVLNPLHPPYEVNEDCELIWSYYSAAGYRTIHLEDSAFNEKALYPSVRKNRSGIGTTYDNSAFMEGLRQIDVSEVGNTFEDGYGCFDNQFIVSEYASTILSIARQYASVPYFNFVWISKPTHLVMSNTHYVDDPLFDLLKTLNRDKLLDNTVLIVNSDHGPWHGAYLNTDVGYLERLLPPFYISFPTWFRLKYPHLVHNIGENSRRLSTQYDVFETLLDLINIEKIESDTKVKREEKTNKLGQSLFKLLPLDRSCESGSIPSEYCICWHRTNVPSPGSDILVRKAVTLALEHLNTEIGRFPLCVPLQLHSVLSAKVLEDGEIDSGLREVSFSTLPSHAEFQATVGFKPTIHLIGTVLRLNVYRGQSDCVEKLPNATYVKTMCYCRSKLG